MDVVLDLQTRIIQWPSAQKRQQTAREVEDKYGISDVIGFMDGTHIRLASAPDGDRDYYNRRGFPSMQLQVVTDSNMLIISAYTGWPGCTHDARVLRNLTLYQKAEEGQAIINSHHILADNAYPLRNWLISPFKNYGHLTPQQQRYNTKLSSARQSVERCFAHLNGRFRRLKEVTFHNPRHIAKLIMAGCILHNLCVIHTDDIEEFMDNNAILEDAENECENIYQHGVHGVARRLRLLQQI
ncbi:putative nuclease HARBI1 [Saccostrea echinata]|uniref:putative nuclease HARBI1 n=1 Tax=Saccostrea echinata TaxID=191078 RepID=UPI002A82A3D0|nr:putative nuclease HARBI1 [Saccostrea echinata]